MQSIKSADGSPPWRQAVCQDWHALGKPQALSADWPLLIMSDVYATDLHRQQGLARLVGG